MYAIRSYYADDAKIIGDVLIESDKRGIDSHGIGRLKPIYIDRIDIGIMNPVTELEIVKDQDATAVIDAHNGMGHVAGYKAMEMAIRITSYNVCYTKLLRQLNVALLIPVRTLTFP